MIASFEIENPDSVGVKIIKNRMSTKKAPYRIQCRNSMWEPVGGSKQFASGKIHAKVSFMSLERYGNLTYLFKCVFNHVFARREKKITKPLSPLMAMKRQYR